MVWACRKTRKACMSKELGKGGVLNVVARKDMLECQCRVAQSIALNIFEWSTAYNTNPDRYGIRIC